MKKNIWSILSLVLIVFALGGCKTRKVSTNSTRIETPEPAGAGVVQRIRNAQVQFNTLSMRGKAVIGIDGNTNNVGIQIRVEKDKRIWASITAIAGIEVARALITPDSIRVMNRLQSTYVNQPFSFVRQFATKQVDFSTLQSVLTGTAVDQLLENNPTVTESSGQTVLSGKKESLDYKMFFNDLLKLTVLNLNDAPAGRALKVDYGAYQDTGNGSIPGQVNISSMAGAKRVNMQLEFAKIEGNIPLEFPFTVPKRYEVIN